MTPDFRRRFCGRPETRLRHLVAGSFVVALGSAPIASSLPAEDNEWKLVLQESIGSDYSKTRQDSLKQVDTNSKSGLRAIWNVLDKIAPRDPLKYDWFVREGAYDALSRAEGEEAIAEIERVLESKGSPNSKEAIVYSIIFQLRRQFERDNGGNEERKVEHFKELLRTTRGIDYFKLVLPSIKKHDPDKKRYGWIKTAFADKYPQVRLAAITGMMSYPDRESIPLLIENLEKLEKKKAKNYKEWVFTRNALEMLTGQYYREAVTDWRKWWESVKGTFSLEKRVEEEASDEPKKGGTKVVKTGNVEVAVNMKIVGEGYPLLVLPKRKLQSDYFRPYFHGIEEFCRVYYVDIPRIQDFKGLQRTAGSNMTIYPTEKLAEALGELMKENVPEEFAILGHGPSSSTLSMYIAAQYPEKVSHLLMINPASAGSVYGNAIRNVEREGRKRKNVEVINGANNLFVDNEGKPQYEPQDDAERGGLGRAISNLCFANPASPEIGTRNYLYSISGDPKVMNDGKWSMKNIFSKGAPKKLPVLVIMGEKDPWSPLGDMGRVAKFFPRSKTAKFRSSAQNPFLSDTYRFTKEVEKFLNLPKKKKKGRTRTRSKK